MSAWAFAAFAILTAGALAALQYLRVRPRRIKVVTNVFWRQAIEQNRARTLLERFQHPRTYLLLLAACLLILLALAAPAFPPKDNFRRVVILEAGLDMAAKDGRFENALAIVQAEADSLKEEQVAVIAADPRARILKNFDEGLAVMRGRLARVSPANLPIIRDDILAIADSLLAEGDPGELVLVTAQPVAVEDERVRVLPAGERIDNAFILSAAFAPDPVDPTIGVFHGQAGFTGSQGTAVSVVVTRGDVAVFEASIEMEPGEIRPFSVPDLAADGSLLSVTLNANDEIHGDDRIHFRLPNRRPFRVVPTPGFELPSVLATVLASLPEGSDKINGGNGPVIRIGPVGSDAEIQVQAGETGDEWLPLQTSTHPIVAGLEFEDAISRAPSGLSPEGIPLVLAGGLPLVSLNPEGQSIRVAESFLDAEASVVRRTAYLVFWARMFQQLAGWSDEALALSPLAEARSTEPSMDHMVMKASLENFALAGENAVFDASHDIRSQPTLWQGLLVAALGLMLVEAVLNLRGKII